MKVRFVLEAKVKTTLDPQPGGASLVRTGSLAALVQELAMVLEADQNVELVELDEGTLETYRIVKAEIVEGP